MSNRVGILTIHFFALMLVDGYGQDQDRQDSIQSRVLSGDFHWEVSAPLVSVHQELLPASPVHPWIAIKDPSVVRFEDKWHLFCTLRKQTQGNGRIRIGYTSFTDWPEAEKARWSVLNLTNEYHGAPQILYFEPHQKWYLIYQAADSSRNLKFGPCFSTNNDLSDSEGWTLPQPLYTVREGAKAGLDFWIICDKSKAHLFFTTLDGRMWRAETKLTDFPDRNWSDPVVALNADIFEASHTYKLRNTNKYLTFVEAQHQSSRYFKAYLADSLDGLWKPLADTRSRAFVSPFNVTQLETAWTDSFSHGELLRLGVDQEMEIDPENLQMLFQGASNKETTRGAYGDILWRLGLLRFLKSGIQ